MREQKHLYRSRDAVVGGVGAGIADYFNIDPVVVRILIIVLTVLTGGLVAVAYVALWVVLQKAPEKSSVVDVQPQEVQSEIYGDIDYDAARYTKCASRVSPGGVTIGSVPPEPPKNYTNTAAPAVEPPLDERASSDFRNAYQPRPVEQPGVSANAPSDDNPISPLVRTALWFGFLLLSFGAAILFGAAVVGVDWWQFWPLLFIIFGLGQMIIPGSSGKKAAQFTGGLVLFAIGAVLLPISLKLFEVESLYMMLLRQWPLLVITVVFFVLAKVTKISSFTLCGGFTFAVFCFFGIVWWGIPTATDVITIELFGKTYLFDAGRWV